MDARIFCKQRPEEGHRKLCCYVLVLFFFLTFFFFYFLFPLLLVSHQIEAGSWFTMAPKMDKTTRYWSWPHKTAMPEVLSAAPESAQGPGLHWDAKVRILGCWDVGILGYWDVLHARTLDHHPSAHPQLLASSSVPLSTVQFFLQNLHSFPCV